MARSVRDGRGPTGLIWGAAPLGGVTATPGAGLPTTTDRTSWSNSQTPTTPPMITAWEGLTALTAANPSQTAIMLQHREAHGAPRSSDDHRPAPHHDHSRHPRHPRPPVAQCADVSGLWAAAGQEERGDVLALPRARRGPVWLDPSVRETRPRSHWRVPRVTVTEQPVWGRGPGRRPALSLSCRPRVAPWRCR